MEKSAKIVPFFYKERKRTQRSFCSFIKNGKECKDSSVLLLRKEKNPKIVPFFYKEQKRMQRLFCYFIKNGKERKDRFVLL